jgi:hypothetical protein
VGPRRQRQQKKKKRERERWAGAGRIRWAGRPFGPKGKQGMVFFLFLFQTSFSNHFSFQIQIKLFQTFPQEFYKLLETTQATKNHASQLMITNTCCL